MSDINNQPTIQTVKRGRGRPRKSPTVTIEPVVIAPVTRTDDAIVTNDEPFETSPERISTVMRPRGRPRKQIPSVSDSSAMPSENEIMANNDVNTNIPTEKITLTDDPEMAKKMKKLQQKHFYQRKKLFETALFNNKDNISIATIDKSIDDVCAMLQKTKAFLSFLVDKSIE
jgi:hypothetical protein